MGGGCTYSCREVCVRFRMDLHTEGALIHGGKFVLGLDLHTQGCTYSWREVFIRFRMDLHMGDGVGGGGGALIHGGKFCVRFRLTHKGVHLFMEGSLR